MTWLFTRATISSITVSAESNPGNKVAAIIRAGERNSLRIAKTPEIKPGLKLAQENCNPWESEDTSGGSLLGMRTSQPKFERPSGLTDLGECGHLAVGWAGTHEMLTIGQEPAPGF